MENVEVFGNRDVMVKYIRNNKRKKKGVLIAIKTNKNRVFIGWSLCNSVDVFNKHFGKELASNRAIKRFNDNLHYYRIPQSIETDLEKFTEKCKRIYKNYEFPAWIDEGCF